MKENTGCTSAPSGLLSIRRSWNRHKLLKTNTDYNNNEEHKDVKGLHNKNSNDYSDKLKNPNTNDTNNTTNSSKHYHNDINTKIKQQSPR